MYIRIEELHLRVPGKPWTVSMLNYKPLSANIEKLRPKMIRISMGKSSLCRVRNCFAQNLFALLFPLVHHHDLL